ncbi:MAG: response regulator, partial [Chitinophagales bacterium]
MNKRLSRPIEILLIEDNEGDIILTKEALRESGLNSHLSVARNGEQGLNFLLRNAPYTNSPIPDLILLDVNMPKLNGLEVLARIKSNKQISKLPVVMLTTSNAEEDINKAYSLHANCYIVKPIGYERFIDVVKGIEAFW